MAYFADDNQRVCAECKETKLIRYQRFYCSNKCKNKALGVRKTKHRVCTINGCSKKHYAKALCHIHYLYQLNKRKERERLTTSPLRMCEGCKSVPLHIHQKHYCSRKCQFKYQGVKIGNTIRKHTTCMVTGCSNPHSAKGFCKCHYAQSRYIPAKRPAKPRCTVEGCEKTCHAKGLCPNHYQQALGSRPTRRVCAGCRSNRLTRAQKLYCSTECAQRKGMIRV